MRSTRKEIAIKKEGGTFQKIPEGRYRLFLVEHDQPVEDDDTLVEHKLIAEKTGALRMDAVAEVSF